MDGKPNILLICLDQINHDWFSLHGHPLVRTPHMDSVGGTGISFDRAFSQCPTCIPARQSMMTGLDPWSIDMLCNEPRQPFPEGKPRLARLLSDAGYQTHAAGKMHCFPFRDRVGFHEVESDEEYRKGENGELHDYERYLRDQGLAHRMTSHGLGPNQYGWRIDSVPEEHSPTHWVADRACNFIERRDPTRPFFLYASFRQPHPPFVVQPEYWEMYRDAEVPMPVIGDWCENKRPLHWRGLDLNHRAHLWREHPHEIPDNIRAYAAMISHIDSMVGMMLGCLAEHKLERDTWILLVGDHGEMLFDHNGYAKATPFRGSAGIPFFIKPPRQGIVGSGMEAHLPRIDRELCVSLTDLMPTILDIAGTESPTGLDGKSLLPALAGDTKKLREYLPLVFNQNFGIADDRYSYCWFGDEGLETLFDHANDPREKHDLVDKPECAEVRARMRGALRDHLQSVGDPHVVDGELTVIPLKWPLAHKAYGSKGMHRGRC
jgi:arylsulfatase A-like enzyme